LKSVKGSITVESAYIIPTIFIIVMMIVYTVFYYHDKNILIGAALETAVVGAQVERREDDVVDVSLEDFFIQRINGKLILYSMPSVTVEKGDTQVVVQVVASRRRMKIQVEEKADVLRPEKRIRLLKRMETIIL